MYSDLVQCSQIGAEQSAGEFIARIVGEVRLDQFQDLEESVYLQVGALLTSWGALRHISRSGLEVRLMSRFQVELKKWRTGEHSSEKKGEFEHLMVEHAAAESGIAHGADGIDGGLSAGSEATTTPQVTTSPLFSVTTIITSSEVNVDSLLSMDVVSDGDDSNLTLVQDEEVPLPSSPISRVVPESAKFPTVVKDSLPVSADKSVRPKEPPVVPSFRASGVSREENKHTFTVFGPRLPKVYKDSFRSDDIVYHRDFLYDPASFCDFGSVENFSAKRGCECFRFSRETVSIGNFNSYYHQP